MANPAGTSTMNITAETYSKLYIECFEKNEPKNPSPEYLKLKAAFQNFPIIDLNDRNGKIIENAKTIKEILGTTPKLPIVDTIEKVALAIKNNAPQFVKMFSYPFEKPSAAQNVLLTRTTFLQDDFEKHGVTDHDSLMKYLRNIEISNQATSSADTTSRVALFSQAISSAVEMASAHESFKQSLRSLEISNQASSLADTMTDLVVLSSQASFVADTVASARESLMKLSRSLEFSNQASSSASSSQASRLADNKCVESLEDFKEEWEKLSFTEVPQKQVKEGEKKQS